MRKKNECSHRSHHPHPDRDNTLSFLGVLHLCDLARVKLVSEKAKPETIPELSIYLSGSGEEPRIFVQPELTVGREASCDLVIPDDTISSHHARFRYHHGQWWLEDLQSTNGTFLNNERMYTPMVIVTGDEITLGKISLQIEIKG